MKITALIPDDLIGEVKEYTNGKNVTESLIKALSEWVNMQKIKNLNSTVLKNPLKFRKDFTPEKQEKLTVHNGHNRLNKKVIRLLTILITFSY